MVKVPPRLDGSRKIMDTPDEHMKTKKRASYMVRSWRVHKTTLPQSSLLAVDKSEWTGAMCAGETVEERQLLHYLRLLNPRGALSGYEDACRCAAVISYLVLMASCSVIPSTASTLTL